MGVNANLSPLVVGLPIVVGAVLLALGPVLPRVLVDLVATVAAFAVTGIGVVLYAATGAGRVVTWTGGWTPVHGHSVGVVLVVDRFGAGLVVLTSALVGVALLYSWRYFESFGAHYHCLFLLFLAGLAGFAVSGDLFDMFVFFELMGAVAYALTALRTEDPSAVQGGLNFAIVNSLGAYLTLMGIGIVYSRTGVLGLPQMSRALSGHRADILVVVGFTLVCTGWLVKAAAVPFHFWTADAEAVAPTPVCIVFSGAMVELGVYGVARIYWVAFSGTLPHVDVSRALLVLGVLTALVGAVMCVLQSDLKRLLAYSTIAHVGLFLIAVGLLTPDGLTGAAMYMVGHAGVKGALFLIAGLVLNRYRTVDEWRVRASGERTPWLAALLVVGALGLAALPPFATGLGKALAEDATLSSGQAWGPVVFVAVSALTGGSVLRFAGRALLGLGDDAPEPAEQEERGGVEPEVRERLAPVPATMLVAVLALLLAALVAGCVPRFATGLAAAAEAFVDRRGYVGQALFATPPAHPPVPPSFWTTSGLLLGFLSAGLAVGVAAAGLYGRRARSGLPRTLRDFSLPGTPLVAGLRRLHSGRVGDYVAWLVLGVAGLTALLAVPLGY